MHENTYYETLEVSTRASPFVIRAAYRCLAQHHHPDKNSGSDRAGEILAELNRAYGVLGDPGRRQAYDQTLKLHHGIAERRNSGTEADDLLDSVVSGQQKSRPFGFRPLS